MSIWPQESRAAAGFRNKNGARPQPDPNGYTHMQTIKSAVLPQQDMNIRSAIEVVSPQEARRLRDTAHFDRQRNISSANVNRLAAEMTAGRFNVGTQIYLCVLPDGRELIVNGNHTLEAVHACGIPQILTVTRKAVRDENEAGRIYAVFDIQKVRSWTDSLRATGAGEDVPNASKVLAAIGVMERGFGSANATSDASRIQRISLIEDYKQAAILFAAATADAPKNSASLVRRAAIMAVALETLRYQPSAASEFWHNISHDDGLTTGQPEKALLSWMRNVTGAAGGGMAQKEHARAAALAWNAAFKGRQLQYVKPNQMGSFFLLGTPWANGLGG